MIEWRIFLSIKFFVFLKKKIKLIYQRKNLNMEIWWKSDKFVKKWIINRKFNWKKNKKLIKDFLIRKQKKRKKDENGKYEKWKI